MSTIEVGAKLEGKVTGITHFGAFVELPGGVTGLVHISEIADSYVKDVKDHLKLDDNVTVKVINVDKDGKIGLSIKKAVDKPPAAAYAGFGHGSRGGRGLDRRTGGFSGAGRASSFEDKMSRFLKDSEERMSSLRKHTESKRGGRGARRG
jgi:S1 RNA binding domain protein